MEKLLRLAFGLDKAPEKLKEVALRHLEFADRLEKAQVQLLLWQKEVDQAKEGSSRTARELDKELKDWDPLNLKDSVKEPKAKAQKSGGDA
jgi:hypothetical protein